ncbi:DUF2786 domain-containing protein [Acidiferrimicrobium sp. IK]|uniref:DUF2786 domain-containing protein n=1 Tax=Acidiferrimicrobium sp. IK TaxID=2871700 RepID=UPI0021CB185E|nr:DUF2786 domain-containing protein [Acidiferrimicrobium sp. IK]MCU4186592.1 DUF2786 domain-containing protein [Acidiferrimicrobium sp. IK]
MTELDALVALVVGGGRSVGAGDGLAFDAAVDQLVIHADRSGRRAVGAAVAKVFATVIAAMWEGGWQPGETARAVRRELSTRHGELIATAIAAEPAAARTAEAPGLWVAQLDELDAHRWWGDDVDWLGPWSARLGVEWIAGLQVAIEALGVLLRLPAMEQLLPPPSAWGKAAWLPASDAGHDDPVLAKVRALLAKAESTSFEAEAEALTAKAQELMSRHSIDDLLARERPGGRRDRPGARRIPVDDPYADAKSTLLSTVASANGVRCVWHPDLALMTVVGFDADLDGIDALFTSLLVQATRRMVAERPEPDRWGRSQTRSFRQSFLLSFAARIGERLAEAADYSRQAAEAELSVSLLPALARRQDEVDEAVSDMFPRLKRHRSRSATNREGWAAGRQAADTAHLDGGRAHLERASGA